MATRKQAKGAQYATEIQLIGVTKFAALTKDVVRAATALQRACRRLSAHRMTIRTRMLRKVPTKP